MSDFSNMTLDEIAAQVHDMHGKEDQGACYCAPECKGRLQAVISDDGSAWNAVKCDACDKRWWHTLPKRPALTNSSTNDMLDGFAAAILKSGRDKVSGLPFFAIATHLLHCLEGLESAVRLGKAVEGDKR